MPRTIRTAPRKTPTQDRAKFTVEALLDATAHVLVKEGYDGTSTNRVARMAGVNIGSLYQYFPGKDALVAALIDRQVDNISRALGEALTDSVDASLPVAVRRVVAAHLRVHADSPALQRALLAQVPRVERLNPIMGFRRRLVETLRGWLEARRSEIGVSDLDFAAFSVVHIVDALTQAALLERPDDLRGEKLLNGIVEVLVRYLGNGS